MIHSPRKGSPVSKVSTPKDNEKLPRFMQPVGKMKPPMEKVVVSLIPLKPKSPKPPKKMYIALQKAGDILGINAMMHLFSFLDYKDLIRLRLVCKNWNLFCSHFILWAPFCFTYYGLDLEKEKKLEMAMEIFKEYTHKVKNPKIATIPSSIDNFRIFQVTIVSSFHIKLEQPIEYKSTVSNLIDFRKHIKNNRKLGLVSARLDDDSKFDVAVYDPKTDGFKLLHEFVDHRNLPPNPIVQVITPKKDYFYDFSNRGSEMDVMEMRDAMDHYRRVASKVLRNHLLSKTKDYFISEEEHFNQSKFIKVSLKATIEEEVKVSPTKTKQVESPVINEKKQRLLQVSLKTIERIAELKKLEEERLDQIEMERRKQELQKRQKRERKHKKLLEKVKMLPIGEQYVK